MKKLKRGAIALGLLLAVGFVLSGCSQKKEQKNDENKIVIGVTPVPHEEIIQHLQPKFKEEGLDVEVKVFDDYIQLNHVLDKGDIDANYFQHKPFLDKFAQENNYKLVSIGGVHVEPLGLYSNKYKTLDEIPNDSKILIPNDPSNGGRALLLLEKNGLIKLKDSTDLNATEKDIVENKKNIKFVPLDASVIPTSYKDEAAGVINSNYAIGAGIDLSSAIVKESKDSPYTNIVVVKEGRENEEKFKKLMKVLHSDEAKKFIEEKYKGEVVPAFTDK